MDGKDLPNWEAFESELQGLRASYAGSPQELLFRGQNDSDLYLITTLEREGFGDMSFDSYYRLAESRIKPAVETFTGVHWDVAPYNLEMSEAFRSDRELLSLRRF